MTTQQLSRFLVVAAIGMFADLTGSPEGGHYRRRTGHSAARPAVAMLQTPLYFEPNRGQAPDGVLYLSRGNGYDVRLDSTGASLTLRAKPRNAVRTVRMTLRGANAAPDVSAEEHLPGVVNYLMSRDERQWRRNLPTFRRVRYRGVYEGIDQVFYGNQRRLEYDFIVSPGADPAAIRTAFDGASSLAINEEGDLVIGIGDSSVRQLRPVIYQEIAGARVSVDGAYRIAGTGEVAFETGAYDRRHPLVIDPVLEWATYLGGAEFDDARQIAIHDGTVIVAGTTSSPAFQSTATETDLSSEDDTNPSGMYVARFDAVGTHLTTTYVAGDASPDGMDVDAAGNIYIVGQTNSSFLPTTASAFLREQPTLMFGLGTGLDGFLMKLNPQANALLYSTYVGGSPSLSKGLTSLKIWRGWQINPGADAVTAVAVDDAGNAYITGYTDSPAFPATVNAVSTELHQALLVLDVRDGFAMKIDTNRSGESAIRYSTYIGGTCTDGGGTAIAVDAGGDIFVAGQHNNGGFICSGLESTAGTAHPNPLGGDDGYVMRIDPDAAQSLKWATYMGGPGDDNITSLAMDRFSNLYVALHDEGQNRARVAFLPSNGQFEVWSHNPGSLTSKLFAHNNQHSSFVFATVDSPGGSVGYVRYTPAGQSISETIFQSAGTSTVPAAIAADYRGVYVAGKTASFLPQLSLPEGSIPGATDAWVGKWLYHPPPTLTTAQTPLLMEGGPANNILLAQFSGADAEWGQLTATVEWGDGAKSSIFPSIGSNGTGSITGNHSFPDDGVFPVGICLRQPEDPSPTCVQKTITVANVAPSVLPAAASVDASTLFAQFIGKVNGSVEVVLSRSASVSDPGVNDTHTGTIAWGDGALDQVAVIPGIREFPLVRHTYTTGGTKNVEVCATDDHDRRCATFNITVPVADLEVMRTTPNAIECTPFNYSVRVRNNSAISVPNVFLTDRLADDDAIRRKLAYLSVLAPGGGGVPVGSDLAFDATDLEYEWGTDAAIDETGTTAVVTGLKWITGPPVSTGQRVAIYERDSATLAWRRVHAIDFTQGSSVNVVPAVSGNYLAVALTNGSRVYQKVAGVWSSTHIATLDGANKAAMRGNTLVLARQTSDRAWIYELIDGVWTKRATVEDGTLGPDGVNDSDFGSSVAVADDGGAVVVGEFFDAIAHVYTKTATGWSVVKKVPAPTTAESITSVAISGDRLVLGSGFTDLSADLRVAGEVYVFRRSGTNWVQEARILSPAVSRNATFGHDVALSGTLLAANEGFPGDRVQLFSRTGTTWNHVATLAPSSGPISGFGPVAIGGGAVVVGQPGFGPRLDADDLPGLQGSPKDRGRALVFGSAAQEDGTLTVNLGTLAAGEERTVVIFATAGADFTSDTNAIGTATVAGGAFDPNAANNTDSSTVVIDNIATTCNDTSGPVVTATVTGTLGMNGWYTSEDVSVAWFASDPESQGTVVMGAGCAPTILNGDTAGTPLTCTATSAGGEGSGTVTIKIDRTPPTVAASAQPVQGPPELVNETDYRVTFLCADAESGVLVCQPETATTASAGALVSGFAIDRAGNRADTLIGLPRAVAGADHVVEVLENCVAPVRLDGRASIDPGNTGLIYTWTGPFGTVPGSTADLMLAPGQYSITLTVTNAAGVSSSDVVAVSIEATNGPVLQNVPAPITVHQTFSGTPAVVLDPPTATAACGPVTVTSDAPASFLVGNTTVTFTATDAAHHMTQATTVVTVVPRINLAVAQAFVDGPGPALPGPAFVPIAGTTATYRVTLTNSGPADATGVVVTTPIPADTPLVQVESESQTCVDDGQGGTECDPIMVFSLDATCAIEGSNLVCHANIVPAQGTTSFDLQLAIPSSRTSQIFRTVDATAREEDFDNSNNERTDIFSVRRVATLTLARSFTSTTLVAGTTGGYSATIMNTGPSDASSVQLSETLPFGMRYTQAPANCTVAGTTLSCHLMSLAANQSQTLGPITFASDPAAMAGPGAVAGNATATEMTGAATLSTNLVMTVQVDASVTLAVDEPIAGETVVLTATAFNSGPSTARELTITIEVPAALASFGTGGPCVPSTVGTLAVAECRFPSLGPPGAIGPNGSMVFGIPVLVKPSARGSVPFDARIVTAHDANAANDTSALAVSVLAYVDLRLSMTAAPNPASAGEEITYSLRLANDGPSDARSARVNMALPLKTVFVSGDGCVAGGGGVVCDGGDLTAGGERAFSVRLRTDQFARGNVPAAATASSGAGDPGESDPDPSDNSATVMVGLQATADLSTSISADTVTPVAGRGVTFVISGHNAGPSGVVGASLALTLPAGVSAASAPSGCAIAGQTVTCRLPDLASGADANITVASLVDPFARGIGEASVQIAAVEDVNDTGAANNSAAVGITFVVDSDLSIDLFDTADPATAGVSASYSLRAINSGPSGVLNVRSLVELGDGMTFESASPGCLNAGGVVTCSADRIDPDASASWTILAHVDQFRRTDVLAQAHVTSADPDRDATNNTDGESTGVTTSSDVSVAVTDSPDPAVAGNFITYSIDVTNNGPSGVIGATLTHALPPGVMVVPAMLPSSCTNIGGVVTCALPNIATGEVTHVKVVAVPSAAGLIVATSTVTIVENDPDGSNNSVETLTKVSSPAGGPAGAGDFDGDGDLDLAVADEKNDLVRFFRNNGHGAFAEIQLVPVGDKPKGLAIGDVDGDGRVDVGVANWGSDDVSVLRNGVTGLFAETARPGTTGSRPIAIAVGDVDGDGSLDLAVAHEHSDSVSILKRIGSGIWMEQSSIDLAATNAARHPSAIAAGDLDGDGRLDLVVTNRVGDSLSVLDNLGGGAFALDEEKTLTFAKHPVAVTLGDYDADGDLDLAIAGSVHHTVSILRNSGGSLTEGSGGIAVGHQPASIATGDLNGDGRLDLAVANTNGNSLSVLVNNGGMFAESALPAGSKPIAVMTGDVNGDGKLDLVVVSDKLVLTVLLGQ